ncbi:response regulator [Halorubrum sp. BV1]|uniref:response regulator n=1 Tax=Halorubrum sp. BV1 TaxID=1498500 RepID=UPI000679B5C2|nr:response regulator [Halorubrum sp. BV1]
MSNYTPAPTATTVQTDTHTAAGGSSDEVDTVVLLHVEPDARSAELFATFAERLTEGFTVRSVDGMEPALDAADDVDCVVTEQRLPDASGVDLVERLRSRGVDIPVVFHTTCRKDEMGARALAAGADAYFPKQPERGQYDRILDRLRELVDDVSETDTATTTTPESSAPAREPSARRPSSEE